MSNGFEKHEGVIAAVLSLLATTFGVIVAKVGGRKSLRRLISEHTAEDARNFERLNEKIDLLHRGQKEIKHSLEVRFGEFHERLIVVEQRRLR